MGTFIMLSLKNSQRKNAGNRGYGTLNNSISINVTFSILRIYVFPFFPQSKNNALFYMFQELISCLNRLVIPIYSIILYDAYLVIYALLHLSCNK